MNFACRDPFAVTGAVEAEKRLDNMITGMKFCAQMCLVSLDNANDSQTIGRQLNNAQLRKFYKTFAKDLESRINAYINGIKGNKDDSENIELEFIAHDNRVRRKIGLTERDEMGYLKYGEF